jgi:hypothetical protein
MAGCDVLGVLTLIPLPGAVALAMLGFTLVMLAWPVLSISALGLRSG